MIRATAVLLGALCAVAPVHVLAGTIDSSLDINLDIVGSIADIREPQRANITRVDAINPQTGDFAFEIPSLGTGGPTPAPIWTAENISVSGNADPFIELDLTITNVSSSPADITVSAVLPISGSFPGPNVLFGEIEGTVSDTNGDGFISLVSIGSTPVFIGTVDGGDALPIAIADITAGPAPGISLSFGPLTDTDPAFGPASSTIGIDLAFTLSAGDTVTIDSFFSLEPVPEPAGVVLLLIGMTAAATARRRD